MGQKRILQTLLLHSQRLSLLAAVCSHMAKALKRAAPNLFPPMYAGANMGHPSREEGFVFCSNHCVVERRIGSSNQSIRKHLPAFFPASHSSLPGRKLLLTLCDACLHTALCIQHARLLEE